MTRSVKCTLSVGRPLSEAKASRQMTCDGCEGTMRTLGMAIGFTLGQVEPGISPNDIREVLDGITYSLADLTASGNLAPPEDQEEETPEVDPAAFHSIELPRGPVSLDVLADAVAKALKDFVERLKQHRDACGELTPEETSLVGQVLMAAADSSFELSELGRVTRAMVELLGRNGQPASQDQEEAPAEAPAVEEPAPAVDF